MKLLEKIKQYISKWESHDNNQIFVKCPRCQSTRVYYSNLNITTDGFVSYTVKCCDCGQRFLESFDIPHSTSHEHRIINVISYIQYLQIKKSKELQLY